MGLTDMHIKGKLILTEINPYQTYFLHEYFWLHKSVLCPELNRKNVVIGIIVIAILTCLSFFFSQNKKDLCNAILIK